LNRGPCCPCYTKQTYIAVAADSAGLSFKDGIGCTVSQAEQAQMGAEGKTELEQQLRLQDAAGLVVSSETCAMCGDPAPDAHDNRLWTYCDGCQRWFHGDCASTTQVC
jgi:hypothetical protein